MRQQRHSTLRGKETIGCCLERSRVDACATRSELAQRLHDVATREGRRLTGQAGWRRKRIEQPLPGGGVNRDHLSPAEQPLEVPAIPTELRGPLPPSRNQLGRPD